MHGLEAKAADLRKDRNRPRLHELARQKGAGEEPADPGSSLPLEDEARPQTDDAYPRMLELEHVQKLLDRGFLARVVARWNTVHRPVLADEPVLRPLRVRPHRRGVDETASTALGGGSEHACAAGDVDSLQQFEVARGLDQPGEVDDGVRTPEERCELVVRDVGGRPVGLRDRQLRTPACDSEDRVDLGRLRE
jgi:hypothetical protein